MAAFVNLLIDEFRIHASENVTPYIEQTKRIDEQEESPCYIYPFLYLQMTLLFQYNNTKPNVSIILST